MKPASSFFLYLPLLTLLLVLPAQAGIDRSKKDQLPPINLLTAKIWTQLDLADFTLTGQIRVQGKVKKHYPIILRTRGHELQYEFTDQALQIHVDISDSGAIVEKRSGASSPWVVVSGADLLHRILDTDITYDDLALDFINWPTINPLGTDSIKTLPAYAYEAIPGPQNSSSYSKVQFWVSTQYWAFLRIDGLNSADQLVKRVEVQSVMTMGEYTCFKEMKVATMEPGKDDISTSVTYIDLDKGVAGSGMAGEKK
jgi:hypothetical protein